MWYHCAIMNYNTANSCFLQVVFQEHVLCNRVWINFLFRYLPLEQVFFYYHGFLHV